MMATVPHVTSGSGLTKFQANGFLLDRVYMVCLVCNDKDNEFKKVLTSPQREIANSDLRAVRMGFVVE